MLKQNKNAQILRRCHSERSEESIFNADSRAMSEMTNSNKAKACFVSETGFRKIQFSANYSQHETHSAQAAHPDEQSPHAQVAQHALAQHDLASKTSAF